MKAGSLFTTIRSILFYGVHCSFQPELLIFYFMGMDKVRFRKPVVPGDQLVMEVQLLKLRAKVVKMSASATVDKNRVAEGEFMATIGG